jgi:hypothetical protein
MKGNKSNWFGNQLSQIKSSCMLAARLLKPLYSSTSPLSISNSDRSDWLYLVFQNYSIFNSYIIFSFTKCDSIKPSLQFYVVLLIFMLPRDHFFPRHLHITTAGVKCHVAAVKICPVLHFNVAIFLWFFGIIDSSTFKCWNLSTTQAGARGR